MKDDIIWVIAPSNPLKFIDVSMDIAASIFRVDE
jgi:hypothetical protein